MNNLTVVIPAHDEETIIAYAVAPLACAGIDVCIVVIQFQLRPNENQTSALTLMQLTLAPINEMPARTIRTGIVSFNRGRCAWRCAPPRPSPF